VSAGAPPPGRWSIDLRPPGGGVGARVTVDGSHIDIEPPTAADDPFVAAAVAEIRRSLERPRSRPACARDPRPGPR
jgi:hypothetical protein